MARAAKQSQTAVEPEPELAGDVEAGGDGVTLDEILAESARMYEAGALGSMRRADLEAAQQEAHRNPRVLSDFLKRLTEVVTLNATTAQACIYSLPRGGKQMTGPSVRFAELVAYAWRSNRISSVIISVDADAVVINGVAHDLETNRIYEVATRRVVQKPKNWRDQEDYDRKLADMQQLAVSSGTSIAIRNAILRLVPRALLEQALGEAKRCSVGKGTMEQKRAAALELFTELGAGGDKVLAALGRNGVADITLDDLVFLRGLVTSIREGAITLAEAMRTPEERNSGSRGRTTATPMDVGPKAPPPAAAEPTTPATDQTTTARDPNADPSDADAP